METVNLYVRILRGEQDAKSLPPLDGAAACAQARKEQLTRAARSGGTVIAPQLHRI